MWKVFLSLKMGGPGRGEQEPVSGRKGIVGLQQGFYRMALASKVLLPGRVRSERDKVLSSGQVSTMGKTSGSPSGVCLTFLLVHIFTYNTHTHSPFLSLAHFA